MVKKESGVNDKKIIDMATARMKIINEEELKDCYIDPNKRKTKSKAIEKQYINKNKRKEKSKPNYKSVKNVSSRKRTVQKRKKVNVNKLFFLLLFIVFMLGCLFFGLKALVNKVELMNLKKVEQSQKDVEKKVNEGVRKNLIKIMIDPGGGGHDLGGKNKEVSVTEKNINLEISEKIYKNLLKQDDVSVILSRDEDIFMPLSERVELSNQAEIDLIVTIKLNGESSANQAYGIETWYFKTDKSYLYGKDKSVIDYYKYRNNLSEAMATNVQKTLMSYVKTRNRGIKNQNIGILNKSDIPSIIVDCGFITNKNEAVSLSSQKYQENIAEGISQGILTFIDENRSDIIKNRQIVKDVREYADSK